MTILATLFVAASVLAGDFGTVRFQVPGDAPPASPFEGRNGVDDVPGAKLATPGEIRSAPAERNASLRMDFPPSDAPGAADDRESFGSCNFAPPCVPRGASACTLQALGASNITEADCHAACDKQGVRRDAPASPENGFCRWERYPDGARRPELPRRATCQWNKPNPGAVSEGGASMEEGMTRERCEEICVKEGIFNQVGATCVFESAGGRRERIH